MVSKFIVRAVEDPDDEARSKHVAVAIPLTDGLAESPLPAISIEPAKPSRLPWTIAATYALAALTLGAMLWARRQSTPEPPTVVRFRIPQPEHLTFMPNFAILPDGSKLAYHASPLPAQIILDPILSLLRLGILPALVVAWLFDVTLVQDSIYSELH
jgi:hypothetical protein